MNFYYDADKLGWETAMIEDETLSYEFDMLVFWRLPDGRVLSATNSGCSCPTPFEDFRSVDELERVPDYAAAKVRLESWAKGGRDQKRRLLDKLNGWFRRTK